MPLICDRLSYAYDGIGAAEGQVALSDIDLAIGEGEVVGIMGRTGSGKSTLIQLMAGLLRPRSGQVILDGEEAFSLMKEGAMADKVGIVFQHPEQQFFETTVEREVGFALRRSCPSEEERALRVREVLESVGLAPGKVVERSPFEMSGGQQRRIAIASVLVSRPKTVIFDEPTSGLDAAGRRGFSALVRGMRDESASTVIVSHDVDMVAETCSRAIILDRGRIVADGETREVLSDIPFVRRFGLEACRPMLAARALADAGFAVDISPTTFDELERDAVARLRAGRGRCS